MGGLQARCRRRSHPVGRAGLIAQFPAPLGGTGAGHLQPVMGVPLALALKALGEFEDERP
ncbi:hypothetical protein CG740_11070 [Streptomyces sp. CB01201]|nr:hypothetical protein CG740_11070 [Streptomyces sp. CB01201]